MNDIQIQNQPVSQVHNASPSFDAEDFHLDHGDDGLMKPTKSLENLRHTLSIEDDESQAAQSKQLTPNTSSTKHTSESVSEGSKIIDLTEYVESKDERVNETLPSDQKKSSDERPQKRKSKRSKSANRTSSSKRKSKRASAVHMSGEITERVEKSPRTPKRKSMKQVPATESQQPLSKLVTPKATSSPATPTKTRKSVNQKSSNDFQKRKEAKGKRADDLRNYLGGIDDTLMVEQRSDDSVSYLTMPLALQGEGDLHKLSKAQTPKTANPMISMGDGGEDEPGRRISYDLEALMSHRGPTKQISNKWESVSVITDDVETVFKNGGVAVDIISLQSFGIKFGEEDEEMGMKTVDLEQPSEDATTNVACDTKTKVSLATVLEDAQNLMLKRPISASVTFVFIIATLVFLGIAVVKAQS